MEEILAERDISSWDLRIDLGTLTFWKISRSLYSFCSNVTSTYIDKS